MGKLRCAVIGTGGMGRNHSRCIQQIEHTELVALCDANEETVGTAAAELGVDVTFTDYRVLLDDSSIDAVTICTPHSMHGPMGLDALDAGKHVITEKPMAVALDQADRMIEMAKRRGVYLGCSEEHRFAQQVQLAKEWMDEGRVGEVFRCAYERGTQFRTPYFAKHNPDAWRNSREMMGGGIYMDVGHHAVDTVAYLLGDITTCYAFTRNVHAGIEGEDSVVAMHRHANDCTSEVIIGPSASGWHFRIIGSEGELDVSPIRGKGTLTLTGRESDKVEVTPPAQYSKCTALREFFTSIAEGQPLEYPAQEARKALAVVLATYESGETGQPVEPG